MLSEISKGNNGCHLEQSSFVMDPNCTIGSFSASLQSPQPFDIKDDDASWRMTAFDVSGTDVLVNGFDSVSITESVLPKEDDKCKDSVKDYHAFRSECPDNECITPRRRSSRNRIQNLATVRARSGMRIAIKKEPVDLSSLQITRKRRSYFSKQARSSVWGLLENLVKSFKHSVGLEIASCKQKSLRRATKSGRENDKHGKNQIGRRSRKSKGKSSIPTGPISLKVKFGSHCLMDVIPLIDNDNGSNKDYTTENEMKKLPKIASNVDDKLGGRGNLDNESVSLSYGCQPGKNAVQDPDVKTLVCHDESPSEEGRLIINGFSDPGTSPDSEVINLIPDTPVSVSEDLHDLTLSNPCAAPGDTPVLRLPKFSNCGVKDLLSPESMSNTQVFGNLMQGEAQKDGSCCSDISVLTTAGNGPGYMFSTESPESGLSEKLIASPDELKVSNRGILNVSGKCKSEVSKSSSREGYKKKGNKEKEDIVHEVKHKNDLVKGLGKATQHSGTEIERSAELGQVGSENGGFSNLDILQNKMGEHLLPQRNAWVQCDDCLKWRRIPSLLADQIEETNCRWTCKDNLDRAFDSCSFAQEKSNSEINAELEISEGSGEEDVSRSHLSLNGPGQKKPLVAQQSCWSRIKSNLFLHRNRKNQTIDEIMVCHCKPPSDGRMGCGDVCLNRMLNIECARGTCPCGELCSNRQFQKRNYAKLKCFKYGKKGYGLQLLEDVSEGRFLIEYVGEVLDMQAYEARQKEYALKGHKHFYFMTLNGSEVIDACAKGNLGRFINHSCDPNCRTEKWMVNGEVCIGLFALRNIKKGEEVTFDYNYVRVFGAAVKKCVCGSPHCRRYIGGDPLNAEVIVQDDSDDEYPEPAVLYEDSDMDDKQDNIICTISSIGAAETKIQGDLPKSNGSPDEYSTVNQETSHQTHASSVMGQENVNLGPSVALVSLNVREESGSVPEGSPAEAETSGALKASEYLCHSSVETSLSLKVTCETMSGVRKECLVTGKATKYSFPSPQESEIASGDAVLSKSLRKSKSSSGRETPDSLKSCPLVRTLRKSSSVKKGKQRNNATVNSRPPDDLGSKLLVSQSKFKKPTEGSSHGHFEAVEEKLNELLDHEGGICKRKDASRSYLKLLLLTAASGDGCNGEAIQSNRDLSMILDAILKTKSRKVLTDIINKNGLQMLHNIMKRYRWEFNKIPILRKLLKVLEYLAVREILSHEHINGAASRAGVESFRDSILGLTDHIDKQVHQIARNFRVRWLPRPPRKRSNSDRKDSQNEMHSCSQYKNNRCRESQNQPCDLGGRQLECTTVASVEADTGVLDGSAASCSDIGSRKKCKHESEWDGDADNPRQVVDDDEVPPGYEFPPGFSSPILASSDGFPCGEHPEPIAIGHLQQRFISQLPVSYGIPFPKVQQFGCPQNGRFDAWSVAPGIPFQPFPPLPPYPRGRRDLVHQNPPSIPGPQRDSYNLGNKYFWKPKFNNNGLGPPRFWGRSGWEWQERNKTTAFAMQGK